ncbi:DUF4406 domain-containing protein [Janthinobacterium sp. YR213]|uniref:DUF4406 domain-containing protein n=1 Tax=Janthinobacterium sp. YR213 TaxID=1881027 RepID=UPI000891D7F6|nr:DUF4406 domain-containing protein [Janthinobacterium sp. YR213]SDH80710.1 protein of unknown function [Janthinobacterium sp. YR213]
MLDLFLLKPSDEVLIEQSNMLQAMACGVARKNCLYLSGPITTGENFLEWYVKIGREIRNISEQYKVAIRSDVIKKNENKIIAIAKNLRKNKRCSVIEPGSLLMESWSQKDYLHFWLRVLEEFATSVYMVDGWQFSVGCATEFRYATSRGLLIFSERGNPITPTAGEMMILAAADKIDKISAGDELLNDLANNLRMGRH